MTPDELETKFKQVCRNMAILAATLQREHPDFPAESFGRAFLFAAIGVLLDAAGDGETARYLREMADRIERGEGRRPTAH